MTPESNGPLNDLWKYDPASNNWTWISGSYGSLPGVYGTKRVAAPDNTPGPREKASSWSDAEGGLWLFGGWGQDAGGHWGDLNDLWRFDTVSNNWTWVSGSESTFQKGIYGTKGIASSDNTPGARLSAATWIDSCGKLWLFGGFGRNSDDAWGALNDLWRFDPRTGEWTWIFGSEKGSQSPSYGTRGLALPSNIPVGVGEATTWIDADDNLWLFGGDIGGPLLNAVWKFDTTSLLWTWLAGSDDSNQPAVYGTKGVASPANVPGAREGPLAWPGAKGEFWLFGGYGYAAADSGYLSDLWKFDPTTLEWTWVDGRSTLDDLGIYGTKGSAGASNWPGARSSGVSWKNAAQGELWLFGGFGFDNSGNENSLSDLWRYHSIGPATASSTAIRVTMVPGEAVVDRTESIQFRARVHNSPNDSIEWSLSGAGCGGTACGTVSDTGLYTAPEVVPGPATVTITAASVADPSKSASATITIRDAAVLVTLAPDRPSLYVGESVLFRTSVEHATDRNVIWSLAGYGCGGPGCGTISDSGLYTAPTAVPVPAEVMVTATSVSDPTRSATTTVAILEAVVNEWVWVSGSNLRDEEGFRGPKGVPGPSYVPCGREGAASWTDPAGRLWLFGGESTAPYVQGAYSDLWMFDPVTKEWMWVSGSALVNQTGSYGTQGVPSPINIPGARQNAVTWTDLSGNLWLFGGFGRGVLRDISDRLSDLWRYDIATGEWTWVSGNQGFSSSAVYGTKGLPAPGNKPGGRSKAVAWTDTSGDLWLLGGEGFDAEGHYGWLNDLWKYDLTSHMWTWECGSSLNHQAGVYGAKGESSPDNIPGGRAGAVGWSDPLGRLWLFGGTGLLSATVSGGLNDLWMYEPVLRQWTWVAGSDLDDQGGIYGLRGVPSPLNVPGARYQAASWSDGEGGLWLFGGFGRDAAGYGDTILNDLWRFDTASREWTWISGSDSADQAGIYGTKGIADAANTPGARYKAAVWTDLRGDLWLFGGEGSPAFGAGGMLNDLWKFYRQ